MVEDHEEENMLKICRYVDEKFQEYRQQLIKQPESLYKGFLLPQTNRRIV